jgi:excisionase family DNA binding protein
MSNATTTIINEKPYTHLPHDLPIMLDTEQAARLCNCTEKNVRVLLNAGKIAGTKLGGKWLVNRDALLKRLGLTSAEPMLG